MGNLSDWIQQQTGISAQTQTQLVLTFVVMFVIFVLQFTVIKISSRYIKDPKRLYELKKRSAYIAGMIALLAVARIWWAGFQGVLTFLGLVSAGLAIALKDIIVNFAGWIFILSRRPFHVGDRIQIANSKGDVIDIGLFMFSLLEIGNWAGGDQSTGRITHIPNGRVFLDHQFNYTQGMRYLWNEVSVRVTFESNWQRASEILEATLRNKIEVDPDEVQEQIVEARRRYLILYRNLEPTVYTEIRENGVQLTGRYLCPVRARRETENIIWLEVLRRFAEHDDISFAYPTTRFFDRSREGSPPPG